MFASRKVDHATFRNALTLYSFIQGGFHASVLFVTLTRVPNMSWIEKQR